MIRFFYNLLFPFAFLLLLPGYLRRMVRRGNYRRHFWQRLGFFDAEMRARLAAGPRRPWLLAVSVGEMLVALKLIAAWRRQTPGLALTLSTTTTTGYQLALERVPPGVEVIYTPIDLRSAVRRTLRALRPSQLVIVDGGVWPNQLWEARRSMILTALVNARMSPRSERRFRRFRRLAVSVFGSLDLVAVSEQNDFERWQALGVPASNLRWTGSVKFDDADDDVITGSSIDRADEFRRLLETAGITSEASILLAGSTHPGEEKILAEVFQRLRREVADLLLIVAPRHVERAASVRVELEALGLHVINRTSLPSDPATAAAAAVDESGVPHETPDVLILDTTGELRDWYQVATLVFMGKSLLAIGGQNPAEAVAAGKPVLFGPHMENFADLVTALLAGGGAVQVRDADELVTRCARLLHDPPAAQRLAENARAQLAAHRGAAARTAALLAGQSGDSPAAKQRP